MGEQPARGKDQSPSPRLTTTVSTVVFFPVYTNQVVAGRRQKMPRSIYLSAGTQTHALSATLPSRASLPGTWGEAQQHHD